MTRSPGVGDVGDVLSDGLEGLEHNFGTARIEDLVKWSRARSCWPATFGLACSALLCDSLVLVALGLQPPRVDPSTAAARSFPVCHGAMGTWTEVL